MTEEWLDHIELPDGQWADLLKRYPYERATAIELARERDMALTPGSTATAFVDGVLRASLWRMNLKHELTGEYISDVSKVGMASKKLTDELALKAMAHYVAWYDEAYAGPKESGTTEEKSPTGDQPPTTEEPS